RVTRPSRAARRSPSDASPSRKTPKRWPFCSLASSTRVCDTVGPESPSLVISAAGPRTSVDGGQARVGAERDLEVAAAGGGGRLGRQRAQHLPGEALVVGLGAAAGRYAHGHRQGAGGLPEVGLEVTTGQGLGQHQRTRLADRDPEVLDVVDGEVETR